MYDYVIKALQDSDVSASNWDLALKVGGVLTGISLIGTGCYLAWKKYNEPVKDAAKDVVADVAEKVEKAAKTTKTAASKAQD